MTSIESNVIWDKEISSEHRLFSLQLKRVWEYRDLIKLFIKRDFITYYKQTVFGPLWYLVQPILSTVMYMLIFGTVAKLGTDSIPQSLFYFSGTMLWGYFSGCFKDISNTFFVNKSMFGKVFFPRLVVPIATATGLLIKLMIQFVLFAAMYVYYIMSGVAIDISVNILLFPIVILWLSVLACGMGMIISAITTKYRDIAMVLDYVVSLCMYATPVVYPLSEVPGNLFTIACFNPVSAPIEIFRYCFFGVCSVPWWAILSSICVTIVALVVGIIVFNKNERTFVDVI